MQQFLYNIFGVLSGTKNEDSILTIRRNRLSITTLQEADVTDYRLDCKVEIALWAMTETAATIPLRSRPMTLLAKMLAGNRLNRPSYRQ